MQPRRTDGYLPLGEYGMLADGRGGALVGADGRVDWLAAPRGERSPLCAALLDPTEGGAIALEPAVDYEVEQAYVEDTMVLATTFRCEQGQVRVTDALNRSEAGVLPWAELARRVEATGAVPMRWRIELGHRLTTERPWAEERDGVVFLHDGTVQLAVVTHGVGVASLEGAVVTGEFTTDEGSTALLALVANQDDPLKVPTAAAVQHRLDQTVAFWRRWSDEIRYDGPYRDQVRRSALVLKGLTIGPTSGQLAALTTSLPEKVGGKRNFDYRFGWVRDASFALDALSRLGLSAEVQASLSWLLGAVRHTAPEVRSMYTVAGEPAEAEMSSLEWLPGYRGSLPVHVGNTAASQLQLGAYGDLMDAVWRYCEDSARLDADDTHSLAALVDHLCAQWRSEDSGLWELSSHEHYTSSKLGCWVALDRAVRLAEDGQLPDLRLTRWRAERDTVRAWIEEHCWSQTKQSYTFYAGTDELDAATLLMARTRFLAPDDPRLASTIKALRTELSAGGPLLYRYTGMAEQEGAFLVCSFWLIEALVYIGRRDEAAALLEQALGYAGHVGLFSEELDPATGDLRGNLPQGLTHLGVIGAATALHTGPPGSSGR